MKVLITNDDGVYAPGLWALAKEFIKIAEVIVVAPDREQSAIGTAITLHHPLRVQKVRPEISGVETWAVGGTPGDSVIMGISNIAKGSVDLVVSGINNGPNTGDDVFISGTVGGALQAFFHKLPAIAVSISEVDSSHINVAARFTALLAARLDVKNVPFFLLNVNIPSMSIDKIEGVKITCLSTSGYNDSAEEGFDGRKNYYWLKHQKAAARYPRTTDAWAVAHQHVSVTPLHKYLFNKVEPVLDGRITCLIKDLQSAEQR
jgi:5'-nucleotidase